VILRSEYGPPCGCPCYFVTNRDDEATHLHDAVYCLRSEVAKRIKEPPFGLYAHGVAHGECRQRGAMQRRQA
jgi:hypothetical protein